MQPTLRTTHCGSFSNKLLARLVHTSHTYVQTSHSSSDITSCFSHYSFFGNDLSFWIPKTKNLEGFFLKCSVTLIYTLSKCIPFLSLYSSSLFLSRLWLPCSLSFARLSSSSHPYMFFSVRPVLKIPHHLILCTYFGSSRLLLYLQLSVHWRPTNTLFPSPNPVMCFRPTLQIPW